MEPTIKNKLTDSYNKNAELRNRMHIADWKTDELSKFLSCLNRTDKLLDLGAGAGQQGEFFADAGLSVTCVDLSQEMVAVCRRKGLNAQVMDLYDLTFDEGTFDAVWSMNCLLHIPKSDLPAVLRGIARVLRTEGLFYLGVYGGRDSEGIWEEDGYSPKRFFAFYEMDALLPILGQVFEVVRADTIPLNNGGLDFQSFILRRKERRANDDGFGSRG